LVIFLQEITEHTSILLLEKAYCTMGSPAEARCYPDLCQSKILPGKVESKGYFKSRLYFPLATV